LSPFQFVIVMEASSKMISMLVNGGLLIGLIVGPRSGGAINIFHLLFADDTLIFSGANPDHLHNLCCLFLCFEAVLGLRVNLVKSKLVLVGNVINAEGLAIILGCRVSSLPMKYLDLPLGASFKDKYIWDDIIEKIERHLAG
jgi:hypothetical protein